jgi:hypothetical protein
VLACAIIKVSNGLLFFVMSGSQPQGYGRLKGKASGAKAEPVMFVAQNAIIFFNNTWVIQGEALWCDIAGFRWLKT